MLYFGQVGSSWGHCAFFGSSWGKKIITPKNKYHLNIFLFNLSIIINKKG
jgi:hypothetical protein